ncbi:MAG: hypothetical protein ABR589_01585 [Chthoniobacterales bacterium]
MRTFFLSAAFAVFAGVVNARELPQLSWECKVRLDDRDQILGSISLRVGERSVMLMRHPTSGCHTLERSEYHLHDVPNAALTAAAGWWAGGGEEFYVTLEGNMLVVFHRTVIEQSEIPRYRVIKRIRLKPTSSNQSMERTAARFASTFFVTRTSSLRSTLALGGGR